ncbi:MAG: hypothetical protein COA52_01390 [Hyphomicrobiales bacterium]|nr:MAG: hypothetical protein COA52_00300 [Hyphomicrobiales bacterium]PCJ96886.1 MAG: hypothetical protein COA52_01390 [Hyphomicrobiales bacterium]
MPEDIKKLLKKFLNEENSEKCSIMRNTMHLVAQNMGGSLFYDMDVKKYGYHDLKSDEITLLSKVEILEEKNALVCT